MKMNMSAKQACLVSQRIIIREEFLCALWFAVCLYATTTDLPGDAGVLRLIEVSCVGANG